MEFLRGNIIQFAIGQIIQNDKNKILLQRTIDTKEKRGYNRIVTCILVVCKLATREESSIGRELK